MQLLAVYGGKIFFVTVIVATRCESGKEPMWLIE
jgi:hypothetical protein